MSARKTTNPEKLVNIIELFKKMTNKKADFQVYENQLF